MTEIEDKGVDVQCCFIGDFFKRLFSKQESSESSEIITTKESEMEIQNFKCQQCHSSFNSE